MLLSGLEAGNVANEDRETVDYLTVPWHQLKGTRDELTYLVDWRLKLLNPVKISRCRCEEPREGCHEGCRRCVLLAEN